MDTGNASVGGVSAWRPGKTQKDVLQEGGARIQTGKQEVERNADFSRSQQSRYKPTNFCVLRSVVQLQDGPVLGAHSHGCHARLPGLPALGDAGQNPEQALEIQAHVRVRVLAVCGGWTSNRGA